MSNAELRELLLPSDLVVPDEVYRMFYFFATRSFFHSGHTCSVHQTTVHNSNCGAYWCTANGPGHAGDKKRPDGRSTVLSASLCRSYFTKMSVFFMLDVAQYLRSWRRRGGRAQTVDRCRYLPSNHSVEFHHIVFILLFVFPIPGVWHDGPTSRDIVSPDRRRQAQEDFLGTGDLRYPYSPDRSPDRTFGDDRLGTGLHGGTCLTAFFLQLHSTN